MKTKKIETRVHALALGTGYVETASWSHMILVHQKGFDTVQEALESLRALTVKYLAQEFQYERESVERSRKWDAENGKRTSKDPIEEENPEEYVSDCWNTIIHGTLQDHGDMWEAIAGAGWLSGPAWIEQHIRKHGLCWLEKAPELIQECVSWGELKPVGWGEPDAGKSQEANALFYAQSHIFHVPKGILRFRSGK